MNHISTYLAHYMAVIAGGAATVSSFSPALLAFLGPHGAAIIGGAAAVVALLHAFGIDPPTATPAKAPAHWLVTMLAVLVSLPLLVTLHGCAALSKFDSAVTSPTSQQYVTAAALAAISVAESRGVTAAQINQVAHIALTADSGTSATLATVASVVNAQIAKLGLNPAGMQAITALEIALEAAIAVQANANPTVAQTQAAVADVLSALIANTGG